MYAYTFCILLFERLGFDHDASWVSFFNFIYVLVYHGDISSAVAECRRSRRDITFFDEINRPGFGMSQDCKEASLVKWLGGLLRFATYSREVQFDGLHEGQFSSHYYLSTVLTNWPSH